MAFFKTILAVLFRTFGLPPRFLSVKPSFLYDHLTTQHSDFSIVLGISLTEKPVDRNTCFCSHVAECFFPWEGLSFRIFTQNKLGVRAFWATKCKKYMTEKFTRAAHLMARNYTNRISSEKMAQEVWNIKLDWKSQLWFKLCADQVQSIVRTALQTYKIEERTFGTPCIRVKLTKTSQVAVHENQNKLLKIAHLNAQLLKCIALFSNRGGCLGKWFWHPIHLRNLVQLFCD